MVISEYQKVLIFKPSRLLSLALWAISLCSVGCSLAPEDAVEGVYRVDVEAIASSDTLKRLDGQAQNWTLLLGQKMLAGVRITLKNKECKKVTATRSVPLSCERIRVDNKKTVVYRSVDAIGRLQFLRATRTAQGIDLEIDGRILPLIRVDSPKE